MPDAGPPAWVTASSVPSAAMTRKNRPTPSNRPVREFRVLSHAPGGERYSRWGFWGFHVDGTPRDHPITKDELLVQASELDRWIAREMEEEPSDLYVPTKSTTAERLAYPGN